MRQRRGEDPDSERVGDSYGGERNRLRRPMQENPRSPDMALDESAVNGGQHRTAFDNKYGLDEFLPRWHN